MGEGLEGTVASHGELSSFKQKHKLLRSLSLRFAWRGQLRMGSCPDGLVVDRRALHAAWCMHAARRRAAVLRRRPARARLNYIDGSMQSN